MLYAQPQSGPVSIDTGNPLTLGLVSAIVCISGVYFEVISGQTARNTGTQRVRNSRNYPNSSSVSFIGTGSGAAPKFNAQIGIDKIAGPFTIFAEASLEVNASTQDVFKSWESGSGVGLGLAMDDSAQVLNGFTGRVNNSNSSYASASTALGANSETGTHRLAIDSDGTNRHTYAYGLLSSTIASSTMPTAHANRRTYMLGGFDPTSQSSASSVSLVLAWSRVLTAAEHAAIATNPWQVFLDEDDEEELLYAPAGSSTLSGSVAESASGVDDCNAVVIRSAALAEAGSGVDSLTAAAAFAGSIAEAATVSDAPSAIASIAAEAVEATVAADSASGSSVTSASVGEASGAADSQDVAVAASVAVAESSSPAESQNAAMAAAVAVVESASLAESTGGAYVTAGAIAEAGSAADACDWGGMVIPASLSESAGASESVAATPVFAAAIAETVSAADEVVVQAVLNAVCAEAAAATDYVACLAAFAASALESAAAFDMVTAILAGDVVFARAPTGSGYQPRRNEQQTRPNGGAQARPAAIQRNSR
ncbi:hypothetical protein GJ700_12690 [Duganella sp. FT92W]|uniref:Uncharacterized protein n=1 Tax=Pseudoduganella rivuli TaxID=2666085 RepID=A0A7X2IMG6_9BURK|nr:hypothetical protein [Pseudoduganella rivuli]MRV72565.1 hypothetical protein [Pseudoduganella rivuli]